MDIVDLAERVTKKNNKVRHFTSKDFFSDIRAVKNQLALILQYLLNWPGQLFICCPLEDLYGFYGVNKNKPTGLSFLPYGIVVHDSFTNYNILQHSITTNNLISK